MFMDSKLSGEDPIHICDFLTRNVEEVGTLEIREGHLMVLFPHLLIHSAGEQYREAANGSRSSNFGAIIH